MPDLSDILVFVATLGTAGACLYVAILTKRATRSMERIEELATCMTALAVLADVLESKTDSRAGQVSGDEFALNEMDEAAEGGGEDVASAPAEMEPTADFAIEPADVGPPAEQWEGDFLGEGAEDTALEPEQADFETENAEPQMDEVSAFEEIEDLTETAAEAPVAFETEDVSDELEQSEPDTMAFDAGPDFGSESVEEVALEAAPEPIEPEPSGSEPADTEPINDAPPLDLADESLTETLSEEAADIDGSMTPDFEAAEPSVEVAQIQPEPLAAEEEAEDKVSALMARVQLLEQKLETGTGDPSIDGDLEDSAEDDAPVGLGTVPGLVDLSAESRPAPP